MASRRTLHVALAVVVSLGALAPLAATQSSDPALKLGPIVRAQAAHEIGWSPVIIRAVDGASLDAVGPAIAQAGGVAGRELRIINSRAAVVPNTALAGRAKIQTSRRSRSIALAGRDGADRRDDRRGGRPPAAWLRRRRRRRRGDRFRRGSVARGSGIARTDSASSEFVDFVNGIETTSRRLRPRDARRRHRRRKRIRLGRCAHGHRAGGAPHGPEGAGRSGQRPISDVIAALDHVLGAQGRAQHPRRQPVGGGRRLRVVSTPIR